MRPASCAPRAWPRDAGGRLGATRRRAALSGRQCASRRLVVVENKLADSDRDVVWQALKYVAYCSSLKKAEIVEIYQKYLDRWFEGANAVTNLCEFLDVEELDDVVLNAGNEQRLVLIVSGGCRPERSFKIKAYPFLLIHEAQQGCRDATYEPSRFPVAVPYPRPHRATPAYVVVTSSDLDTSRNKASVSGLSWISRYPFASGHTRC